MPKGRENNIIENLLFLLFYTKVQSTIVTTQINAIQEVRTIQQQTRQVEERRVDNRLEETGVEVAKRSWKGYVSSYGEGYGNCLGCTPRYDQNGQLWYQMANGERLDDARFTIAFFDLSLIPLNSRVSVTNLTNGKSTGAVVTDTGGFMECCDRIADLSIATAQAIEAKTDLDLIEIKTLEVEK